MYIVISGGRRRFILLLITGRSVPFQISVHHSHVHVHPNREFRSNANRCGDQSACEEAVPASRNLISANGAPVCEEQLPFFRNGATFRNVRSANSGLRIGLRVRWRCFRFYSIYRNRRAIDMRTICRGLYEVADKCYGLRWQTILRMHARLSELTSHEWEFITASNPRRNDSEANSHRSRVLDRSRSSISRH